MSQQRMVFHQDGYDVPVKDTHVTAPADLLRLSEQSVAVLARLKAGPATARELSQIALGYRQRVHDLRSAGYRIPEPVASVYRLED